MRANPAPARPAASYTLFQFHTIASPPRLGLGLHIEFRPFVAIAHSQKIKIVESQSVLGRPIVIETGNLEQHLKNCSVTKNTDQVKYKRVI